MAKEDEVSTYLIRIEAVQSSFSIEIDFIVFCNSNNTLNNLNIHIIKENLKVVKGRIAPRAAHWGTVP